MMDIVYKRNVEPILWFGGLREGEVFHLVEEPNVAYLKLYDSMAVNLQAFCSCHFQPGIKVIKVSRAQLHLS